MKYLNKIKCTHDVKKMPIKHLSGLCADIRDFIIKSVSHTGGHLASNLGVVELTVALHYCFDFSHDKVIWDVGHQSYVHKILTGRREHFNTLRKLGGLSGFPKISESQYDFFNTGHSSTSISAGLGMAIARDLNGEDHHVISVIGDGSLTGGLAFEGLNNAGNLDTNFIVILNDNEMSISENVGAMSRYLTDLRTAPGYLHVKEEINELLHKIPIVGGSMSKTLEKAKNSLRYVLVEGSMFEELGFTYVGPVDGHDIDGLIEVLNKVKQMKGSVLLHVKTSKGKGYFIAESDPKNFHGVDPFDVKTGCCDKPKNFKTYTDVFSEVIVELAENNNKLLAITASMTDGTGLTEFYKRFPKRLYDVGISEGHAVTFAAGLATQGYIPVFAVYSTFLQRSYDQILHDVCIQNLPVVFAIDRAGVTGPDGETHQGLFDLSYLSHIPNMVIMAPRSKAELTQMLEFAVYSKKPVAVRYSKGRASELLEEFNAEVKLGCHELIFKGNDIAIISVGAMFDTAHKVYNELANEGYSITLINARFIKPINESIIDDIKDCKYIFTLEDNVLLGGYYSCLSAKLRDYGLKIIPFAFPDVFINHGTRDELFEKNGLDYVSICNSIKEILSEVDK